MHFSTFDVAWNGSYVQAAPNPPQARLNERSTFHTRTSSSVQRSATCAASPWVNSRCFAAEVCGWCCGPRTSLGAPVPPPMPWEVGPTPFTWPVEVFYASSHRCTWARPPRACPWSRSPALWRTAQLFSAVACPGGGARRPEGQGTLRALLGREGEAVRDVPRGLQGLFERIRMWTRTSSASTTHMS